MIYTAPLARIRHTVLDRRLIERVTVGALPMDVVGPDGRPVGSIVEVTFTSWELTGVVIPLGDDVLLRAYRPSLSWVDEEQRHVLLDGIRLDPDGILDLIPVDETQPA